LIPGPGADTVRSSLACPKPTGDTMPADTQERTYTIKPGYRLTLRLCLAFFLLFGLGFIALLWLAEDGPLPADVGPYIVVAIGSGFFLGLAATSFRTLKQVPFHAVTVDEDGLWPAHRPKDEALVPWDAVADIRQHPARHFLELFDERGERLLRLEYQLEGFADLRSRVLEHLRPAVSVDLPERFIRKPVYHYLQLGLAGGLVALGAYLAGHSLLLALVPLGLGTIGAVAYVRGLCGLTLDRDAMTLHYPLASRTIAYDAVDDVALVDRRGRGTLESVVRVTFRDDHNPLTLAGLGVDNTILYEKFRKVLP